VSTGHLGVSLRTNEPVLDPLLARVPATLALAVAALALAITVALPPLGMAGAIIGEASLSFLGLGVQPPTPSWGSMRNGGRVHLLDAPHLTVFSGLAIALVVLGFTSSGDGLRELVD